MSERVLTRETMLDMSVNFVPIGIILFFVALFLAVNPYGWALLPVAISHGLLVVPMVVLAVVTYLAGRAISRDERSGREAPTHDQEAPTPGRETADVTTDDGDPDDGEGGTG